MNEKDIIEELFQKVELNYPLGNLEEAVLQKIKIRSIYKKQKRIYTLVGKIGFVCFVSLCVLFALIIGGADLQKFVNTIYLLVGAPFILLLFMAQLEVITNRKTTKHPSL